MDLLSSKTSEMLKMPSRDVKALLSMDRELLSNGQKGHLVDQELVVFVPVNAFDVVVKAILLGNVLMQQEEAAVAVVDSVLPLADDETAGRAQEAGREDEGHPDIALHPTMHQEEGHILEAAAQDAEDHPGLVTVTEAAVDEAMVVAREDDTRDEDHPDLHHHFHLPILPQSTDLLHLEKDMNSELVGRDLLLVLLVHLCTSVLMRHLLK